MRCYNSVNNAAKSQQTALKTQVADQTEYKQRLGPVKPILEEKIEADKNLWTDQSVSSLRIDPVHMVSPAQWGYISFLPIK